ncbi:uncharacterized protein LOC143237343 isoform X2 [Tachypleus tridentatus]|uniref:uncharacterized protein LOC143237343 isoform X2 n=1 Tax=Tachypleus tridentatus TaxID=6853 RepID=UPI003FD4A040
MKMGKVICQVVILCQLLCSLLAFIQTQSTEEEIKERLEVLDCTNTTCYNIKTYGPNTFLWITYSSKLCPYFGMTPAKPSDEETAKFLMDLASRTITDDSPVWLGLSQEETVNNSAFINLWGTSQPQTVEDGKVAMNRISNFKWEVTDPQTYGWPICEIPKAKLLYCVNNNCYTLYPTLVKSDKAILKVCELVGKKAAVLKTPELAKQLAGFYSFGESRIWIGIYLYDTRLVDVNQNVIGNRDEWSFETGEFDTEQKCIFMLSGELHQGDCSRNMQYPLCEDVVLDDSAAKPEDSREAENDDEAEAEEEGDDKDSSKEEDNSSEEEDNSSEEEDNSSEEEDNSSEEEDNSSEEDDGEPNEEDEKDESYKNDNDE